MTHATEVNLVVPADVVEPVRLDIYIARQAPWASRAAVQRGIRDGQVTLNDAVARRPSVLAHAGDVVRWSVRPRAPSSIAPEAIPLDIVYEDDCLIIVNKAAGMPVHPGAGRRTGTLVHALLHHVGSAAVHPDRGMDAARVGLSTVNAMPAHPGESFLRPGIVHRLDKDTSGILVVAKDDASHRVLALQFERRTIKRQYLGIVWGIPDPPFGVIDAPIGRDPRNRQRMAVAARGKGKAAATSFEMVEAMRHTSLVRFKLQTGRTHQIRVHARHIGHPVLGDVTYDGQRIRCGDVTARRRSFFVNLFEAMHRQALHARTLGFVHPRTGEDMKFTCALPDDMEFVLGRLKAVEG